MSDEQNNVDVSALRLAPDQWYFIKGEEAKRTQMQAELSRDLMRAQAKAIQIMEIGAVNLRDQIAISAMQGMYAGRGGQSVQPKFFDEDARLAYVMADAMLKAREV